MTHSNQPMQYERRRVDQVKPDEKCLIEIGESLHQVTGISQLAEQGEKNRYLVRWRLRGDKQRLFVSGDREVLVVNRVAYEMFADK